MSVLLPRRCDVRDHVGLGIHECRIQVMLTVTDYVVWVAVVVQWDLNVFN